MEPLDLREHGRGIDGQPIHSSDRLFFQFLAWGGCADTAPLIEALAGSGLDATLYHDMNDPLGIGLACVGREPETFVSQLHPFLRGGPFAALPQKPEHTMLGRSYTLGYEQDLDNVLVQRPYSRLINPDWPWAVWYPLRRNGAFQQLDHKARMEILSEHGRIGAAYGAADHGHDIRLACFGLDKEDNDFIVGLLGKELHPLSKIVETMRGTVQTSQYMDKLGPFFVGRVAWQASPRDF